MKAKVLPEWLAETIGTVKIIAGLVLSLTCIYFIRLGLGWVVGEPPLLPPGWYCDEADPMGSGGGQCYPLAGWRFEYDAESGGRIAVHDGPANGRQHQLDVETAELWHSLTNEQRRKILAHTP